MSESVEKAEEEYDEKNEASGFKRSLSKQVILGLLTNFSSIAPSMGVGFSAIALPALTDTSSKYFLNDDEASWFASITSLATPFGSLLCGPIADKFGRRSALFSINITCFISWLIVALAFYVPEEQYVILLIGRGLSGLSGGLSSMTAAIYMAEISTAKLRGMFCAWNSVGFALGVLIVYLLGYVLKDDWGIIALITAVFPCVGMSFTYFMVPESPSWLISKNRVDEAKTNMCKIFGTKDYVPEVAKEIENLIKSKEGASVAQDKSLIEQTTTTLKQLVKPNSLKPLCILTAFFFFQQFAGTFVIVAYAVDIVEDAGVELDAYLTTVLIGVVRLLSAALVSYIYNLFDRRPLSIISGIGMTVSMMALAGYILAIHEGQVSDSTQESLLFLPVLLILAYFLVSTLGFLPIPYAMSAELFPAEIRGTASGVAAGMGYVFNFVAVKIYPNMVEGIGTYGVFFFYGAISLVGTIFVLIFLPETRGKSLQEIEEYFQKKPSKGMTAPVGT